MRNKIYDQGRNLNSISFLDKLSRFSIIKSMLNRQNDLLVIILAQVIMNATERRIFFLCCSLHKRSLDRVCVDKGCGHHTLVCDGCINANHLNHNIVDLIHFVSELDNMRFAARGSPSHPKLVLYDKFKKLRSFAGEMIVNARREMDRYWQKLDVIQASFERLDSLFSSESPRRVSEFIYTPEKDISQINEELRDAVWCYLSEEKGKDITELNRQVAQLEVSSHLANAVLDGSLQELKSACDNIKDMFQPAVSGALRNTSPIRVIEPMVAQVGPYRRFQPGIQQIREPESRSMIPMPVPFILPARQPQGFEFGWVPQLKHQDIKILDTIAQRTADTTNGYWVCCLASLGSATSWRFQIHGVSMGGLVVGVMDSQTARTINFNKGSAGGYSVSSLAMASSTNSINTSMAVPKEGYRFPIEEDSIMQCTLNGNELTLRNGHDYQVLPVKRVEPPNKYYACAFLSRGCSISITRL